MTWLKNKLTCWLFRLGARLLFGWWAERVDVVAVPPQDVRERLMREAVERDRQRARLIARAIERTRRDAWPDLYDLPPINTVSSREWN